VNTTLGDVLDQALGILDSLSGLPGHILVGISCIVVGYALRFFKRFPNDAIPLVCILWGMVFNPLLAPDRALGTSLRLWAARNAIIGLIVGALAWALHRYVIKKFEDRLPIVGEMLAEADRRSDVAQIAKIVGRSDINIIVDKKEPVPTVKT
jgi:hypothetical protein